LAFVPPFGMLPPFAFVPPLALSPAAPDSAPTPPGASESLHAAAPPMMPAMQSHPSAPNVTHFFIPNAPLVYATETLGGSREAEYERARDAFRR
jgi:hypothetical protein